MQRRFLVYPLALVSAAIIGGCQAVPHTWLSGSSGISADSTQAKVTHLDLFPDGLTYIGYRAAVTDTQSLQVAVNRNQVNDLLKTIVFSDPSNKPPEVTFNTPIPLSVKLGDLPLAPNLYGSWFSLLEELKGRRVTLEFKHGKCVSGRLIAVQAQWPLFPDGRRAPQPQQSNGQPAIFPLPPRFAELYRDGKVIRVSLVNLSNFRVHNRHLRASLREALGYIADNRQTGAADIAIRFRGRGQRTVHFGYATQAPLWRMTYRLILPSAPGMSAGTSKTQILADVIVHNTTATPWRRITLQVDGAWPKSFIENLIQPLYRRRPVLPLPPDTTLTPQNGLFYLNGGLLAASNRMAEPLITALPVAHALMNRQGMMPMFAAKRLAMSSAAFAPPINTSVMATPQNSNPAFSYVVHDVSIGSERSASFPVFSAPVSGEVVSAVNVLNPKNHLRRAVFLFNNSRHYLPAGPITVFQGSAYTGEINASAIPIHSRNILPFAVDLSSTAHIQQTQKQIFDGAAFRQGSLNLRYLIRMNTKIKLKSLHQHPITVAADFGREMRWKFAPSHYRIIRTADGMVVEIPVKPMSRQSYLITRLSHERTTVDLRAATVEYLAAILKHKGLTAQLTRGLDRIIALKKQINADTRRMADIDRRIADLNSDESRIRRNLAASKSAPAEARVFARELVKLDSEIAARNRHLRAVNTAFKRTQVELNHFIDQLP